MNATISPAVPVPASAPAASLHWVAVYLVREVPHPEEGGWIHAEGELITDPELYAQAGLPPAVFLDEYAAWAYARRLEDALALLNRERPPRHSVLSRGTYEALVSVAPAFSPDRAVEYSPVRRGGSSLSRALRGGARQ